MIALSIRPISAKGFCRVSRLCYGDDGTGLCYVLEPPWRNNVVNVSCIPAGVYQCEASSSLNHNGVVLYEVMNVPGRTGVRIHAGNTVKDTQGCLLVGFGLGSDAQSISHSDDGLIALHAVMAMEPFQLTVFGPDRVIA